jgi:hypothetical protein
MISQTDILMELWKGWNLGFYLIISPKIALGLFFFFSMVQLQCISSAAG